MSNEMKRQPHDEIIDMWNNDAIIDDNHLDHASIDTSKLHAKYLNILVKYKMRLSKAKNEYKNLRQKKFRYYRGEMSKDELSELGWNQWQGVKPIKSEMEEFLEGDSDLNNLNLKLEYYETVIQLLDSIMGQIKSRDWAIKNSIQWKMFIAGN